MMTGHKKHSLLATLFILLCLSLIVVGCAQGSSGGNVPAPPGGSAGQVVPPTPPVLPGQIPSLPRIHLFKLHPAASTDSLQMTYHKGPVMRITSASYAIFWEPPLLQDGFPTHVSSTYNSLIERYFKDVGGSGLYQNNSQYYDTAGQIVNSSTFGGAWLDTSPYPFPQCLDPLTPHGCLTDIQIQEEVTKAIQVNHWTGGDNHLFFVFTSSDEGSCADIECSFKDFCAYHSFFTSGSQAVLYANMPYTTSLPDCVVKTSPNNDQDADSTINVTSHEQMEAVTDPHITGWYDANGGEIGDKCAWNFGSVSLDGGKANVEWNGHFYIVQQEWSNAHQGCTLNA